jgi:excinuclease ABC subunit B
VREFFPNNAVEYFVSYYDYYQPEAYVPSSRHLHREGRVDQRAHRADAPVGDQGAARAPRRIIVATVSAIYGLGDPEEYFSDGAAPGARRAHRPARADPRRSEMQYTRNDIDLRRGTYRVRGESSTSFRPNPNARRCASSCSTTRSSTSACSTR